MRTSRTTRTAQHCRTASLPQAAIDRLYTEIEAAEKRKSSAGGAKAAVPAAAAAKADKPAAAPSGPAQPVLAAA
jgi:hypothetical protein